MKISVVIPALNEAKLLPITLGSINRLQRKPDELIIVDNGSSDDTYVIAKHSGATVVRVPTRGLGLARQKGMEAARGDIIACTDADTTVPVDWLTKIDTVFSESNPVAVFGNFCLSDGPWWYRFHVRYIQNQITKFMFLFHFPMSSGCNMAFRRKAALAVGGFPTEFTMLEDNEMMKRLMKIGSVLYKPDIVVTTSGRRSKEGFPLILRYIKGFFWYTVNGRGNFGEFPAIR